MWSCAGPVSPCALAQDSHVVDPGRPIQELLMLIFEINDIAVSCMGCRAVPACQPCRILRCADIWGSPLCALVHTCIKLVVFVLVICLLNCLCVYYSSFLYLCLCAYMYACLCLYVFASVFSCLLVCLRVCVCCLLVCVCVSLRFCVIVCSCVCLCVIMYCVFACVCVWAGNESLITKAILAEKEIIKPQKTNTDKLKLKKHEILQLSYSCPTVAIVRRKTSYNCNSKTTVRHL